MATRGAFSRRNGGYSVDWVRLQGQSKRDASKLGSQYVFRVVAYVVDAI
jgi:hypothetical protein